jgi:hypothetical protein
MEMEINLEFRFKFNKTDWHQFQRLCMEVEFANKFKISEKSKKK